MLHRAVPFFATPTQTYYYEVAGDGPALLLLHGFTGSSRSWAAIVDALAGRYRLITPDLPGHGRSDAPPHASDYALPTVAGHLVALLDHLGQEDAHLLGYSMGGRLALYLALRYAQRWRSLILESASPGLASASGRQARIESDEALAKFIEKRGVAAFVERWEALPLFASHRRLAPEIRDTQRAIRLQNRRRGLANGLRGMGTGIQAPLWERLADLTMPTLLVAGALDEKFVAIARQMSRRMPRVRLEIVPDAGHTVHLEQAAAYVSLLRGWLQSLT